MPALTNAKREAFCHQIVAGKKQAEAYALAGFAPNDSNCNRMFQRADVQKRIRELHGKVAKKVVIDQARVLEELAKIGFSDIRKLFTEAGSLKRVEDLDDETAAFVSSVKVVTRRVPGSDRDDPEYENVAEIKQWDKLSALEKIGKHLGMFTEKVEHTGKDGGPIELDDMSLARLVAFHLTKAAK